jgi:hypothetical protein
MAAWDQRIHTATAISEVDGYSRRQLPTGGRKDENLRERMALIEVHIHGLSLSRAPGTFGLPTHTVRAKTEPSGGAMESALHEHP